MMLSRRGLVTLLFLSGLFAGWIDTAHATSIDVNVTQNPGNVMIPESSLTMGGNVASDDAFVYGSVQSDTLTTLYVSVSSVHITLSNGPYTITATLRGTIGNVAVSTTPQPITVGPGDPASINLVLDIDESSLSTDKRAGIYSSGSIQILATD